MRHTKLAVRSAALCSVGLGAWLSTRGYRRPVATPEKSVDAATAEATRASTSHTPPPLGSGLVRSGPPSMLHLDPHHTNRSGYAGPRTNELAWTFDTGGPVQGGAVELEDGTLVVGSLSGKLFGLSPLGVLRFSVDLGARVYATPLVWGERIYVGSDAARLFAIDRNGAVQFQLKTSGEVDTGAVPTPGGAFVFSAGNLLYASKPDATLLWRAQAQRKCYSSPAVADDGTVFVGSQDDHLYAIGPDGALRWKVNLGADVDSSPVLLDDGTIVVGSDRGEVVALTPGEGQIRWRSALGGYVRGALSVARDGRVLVGSYGPIPRLFALSPDTGESRTLFTMVGAASAEVGVQGGPVQDSEGRLYFGAQDDNVYGLDADGTPLWTLRTGGDVDAPAVITRSGLLVIGSDDGRLYAIGHATARP